MAYTPKNFVNLGQPTVDAAWLNNVDQVVNNTFAGSVSGLNTITYTGVADSSANLKLIKNSSYIGGTTGFVTPALEVVSNVGAGDSNYEWAFLSIMNNSSASGENVAVYGQGNRQISSAGPTWGGVMEVREVVAVNDPPWGLVGLEIDNRSNGTDANGNRIGVDVVVARYNPAGAATTIWAGYRVQSGGDASVTINHAFLVQVSGTVANCFTVASGGTIDWGINLGAATFQSGAMAIPQGAPICFDANGYTAAYWNGTGSGYFFDYGTNTSARAHQLEIATVVNAVNYPSLYGCITGGAGVTLSAVGTDANITLQLVSKGNNPINFYTNGGADLGASVGSTINAVNYPLLFSNTTTNAPGISSQGSDTNVALALQTQGVAPINFYTSEGAYLACSVSNPVGSCVNYPTLSGNITGQAVNIGVAGTDTNVNLTISSKAAGNIMLQPNTGDVQWGKALVALGGGSSATLGTIGGTGPATAGQNTWMRVKDSTGATFWVPAWK